MKQSELKQLIKEEIKKIVDEGLFDRFKKDYRIPPPIKKDSNHYYFENPEAKKGYEVFFYGGKYRKDGMFDKKGAFAYQYSPEDNNKEITIKWLNKHNVPYTEHNTSPLDHPDFNDMIMFDAKYVEPNPSLMHVERGSSWRPNYH